jgi:hypothetical protein
MCDIDVQCNKVPPLPTTKAAKASLLDLRSQSYIINNLSRRITTGAVNAIIEAAATNRT